MTDTLAPTQTDAVTLDIAREHGLSEDEWTVILDRLGRAPKLVELGVFSVMWSEHCSYKSSRKHLAKLPTTGPHVIQGPGENAGVVDIGDGQAAIFKMESHNHPSFIEPYQGAATGVGGILRDVFTMGARPVAVLDALSFGSPEHAKTRSLVAGVVAGIGGYGNCVGVPTVAGETRFHTGYDGNILVNAMAVGVADTDKIFYARGAEPGQPIVYVGSKTGRDGIHGATMASAEFDEASEEKRPTVQVGDPFTEKLLIEACLELMATDAIAAIQDMGAAGLTSSSVEMADKGGVGVELDLDKVPQREEGMTAYEMMLSESQERMLMILKPGREAEAEAIFTKWELDVAVIGRTTASGRMVLTHKGETVCDIPVAPLADDAPKYDRPTVELMKPAVVRAEDVPEPEDYDQALLKLLASPDLCSKRWIWEQYDRHVMADTVDSSESQGDAGVVRVHGTNKGLALTCDVTPRYCQADPYEGGKQAVAEAHRNLSAVGATPIAITDCLNFGNPERPEIMAQFVACIEGMAEACRALDMPVVSGNVSLYNETNGVAIPPTPGVGAVGLIEDLSKHAGIGGLQEDDVLLLLGATEGALGQSLYLREVLNREDGAPPPVDLAVEKAHGALVRELIAGGLVTTAHDIGDGGLLVSAAEMALASDVGLALDAAPHAVSGQAPSPASRTGFLFGEDGARFLLGVSPRRVDEVVERARVVSAPLFMLARAGGAALAVMDADTGPVFSVGLAELRAAREDWLPRYMRREG